jgi:membrane-bound acyltransferase YfiQ involved in biofilm formation
MNILETTGTNAIAHLIGHTYFILKNQNIVSNISRNIPLCFDIYFTAKMASFSAVIFAYVESKEMNLEGKVNTFQCSS